VDGAPRCPCSSPTITSQRARTRMPTCRATAASVARMSGPLAHGLTRVRFRCGHALLWLEADSRSARLPVKPPPRRQAPGQGTCAQLPPHRDRASRQCTANACGAMDSAVKGNRPYTTCAAVRHYYGARRRDVGYDTGAAAAPASRCWPSKAPPEACGPTPPASTRQAPRRLHPDAANRQIRALPSRRLHMPPASPTATVRLRFNRLRRVESAKVQPAANCQRARKVVGRHAVMAVGYTTQEAPAGAQLVHGWDKRPLTFPTRTSPTPTWRTTVDHRSEEIGPAKMKEGAKGMRLGPTFRRSSRRLKPAASSGPWTVLCSPLSWPLGLEAPRAASAPGPARLRDGRRASVFHSNGTVVAGQTRRREVTPTMRGLGLD